MFALLLASSWEIRGKPTQFTWTNLYLTSLELEKFGERTQTKQLEDCILYTINCATNGLKLDFSDMEVYEDRIAEKVMSDHVVRKR